jgi:hypothetical protein
MGVAAGVTVGDFRDEYRMTVDKTTCLIPDVMTRRQRAYTVTADVLKQVTLGVV